MDARNDFENMLKNIADDYAESYGGDLRREMEELEKGPEMITSGLDAKVQFAVKAARRKKASRIMGVLAAGAACLLVAFVAPAVYRQAISSAPASSEKAVQEAAGEAPEYPADDAGYAEPEAGGEAGVSPTEGASPGYGEIIPLSVELPDNFTISTVEQDVGKTIYHLDNTEMDDAVVTMERTQDMPDVTGLNQYDINGHTAYGKYLPDYSVLVFNKDDILYELTCKYDINTLVELGSRIL